MHRCLNNNRVFANPGNCATNNRISGRAYILIVFREQRNPSIIPGLFCTQVSEKSFAFSYLAFAFH